MKNDQIEEGKIAEGGLGIGAVTRSMVVKRAREIAVIGGRGPNHLEQSDWDQAWRELTGQDEIPAINK